LVSGILERSTTEPTVTVKMALTLFGVVEAWAMPLALQLGYAVLGNVPAVGALGAVRPTDGFKRRALRTCGYHRRDEELAELKAVLAGQRRFAELPPRV
jgi:hypothetical protein